MKKLFLAACAATMMAGVAQAFSCTVYMDKPKADADKSNYHAYFIDVSSDAMKAYSYNQIAEYVCWSSHDGYWNNEKYNTLRANLYAMNVGLVGRAPDDYWRVSKSSLSNSITDYYIIMYEDDSNSAESYRLLASGTRSADSSNLTIGSSTERMTATFGAAPAPEPTSGLLLLLGMAGLALKRKRA